MRLSSVSIYNFQSHQETRLDFDPGTNVILGLSDSGKSAIIRAIYWVLFNRPVGDFFRSQWGGDTVVRLAFDTGDWVERWRTDTENKYVINGVTLKAVRTDVPEEVKKLFSVDSRINIQLQKDSFFLVDDSPGQAARHFNEVAGLNTIDEVVTNLNRRKSSAQAQVRLYEDKVTSLSTHLDKFSGFDAIWIQFREVEKLSNRVDSIQARISQIRQSLVRYRQLVETVSVFQRRLKPVRFLFAELESGYGEAARLNHLQKSLRGVVQRHRSTTAMIEAQAGLVNLKGKVDLVVKAGEKVRKLSDKMARLEKLVEDYRSEERVLSEEKVIKNRFEKQFNKELKAHKVCPLCGQRIKGGIDE